jgi:hypothetical protein
MLERFRRSSSEDVSARRTGAVATAERPDGTGAGDPALAEDRTLQHDTITHDDRPIRRDSAVAEEPATRPVGRRHNGVATAAALETARARQRDEFGGVNWGASFFGWLVAVGVAALLTSLLAAAGAAIGLTVTTADATSNAKEISLGGGIALLVVLMLAYYAGGYVAGRMSRFDGGRQGLGTWAIGLIVTVALAVAAVILGDQYNILERLNLPSLPVGDQTLATGGLIALAAIIVGTMLAAMFGGKVGERYHRRVDRAGFVD